MQAEADPRILGELWRRPHVPKRPDPLFVLVLDASGSMEGENAAQSFAGAVILREACRLNGLPLSIIRFSTQAFLLESWRDRFADANIPAMARLLSPGGTTNLVSALDFADRHAEESGYRHPVFLVMSDGGPVDPPLVKAKVDALLANGTSVLGIGLGPGTKFLADLVPGARTDIWPAEFPDALAGLLEESVAGIYA